MKKFFAYIILLPIIVIQSYFALPPIPVSARESLKEMGRAEAYYRVVISRNITPQFIIKHALERCARLGKECLEHRNLYLQNLIGHKYIPENDFKHPLVQEAICLFEQIKLHFMYRHLIENNPSFYQRLLNYCSDHGTMDKLSSPDFIEGKFL